MRKFMEACRKSVADHGDKAIVVEVGLAVIAVALLVLFKGSIQGLMDTVLTEMGTTVTNLFKNS